MNDRWIKIFPKIMEWEWYGDPYMVALWLHLLCSANWKDREWQGMTVKRGQLITSVSKLAEAVGLTERQTRCCLERLMESKQIVKQTTNKYTIITICNYDSYQEKQQDESQTNDKQNVTPTANKRQTNVKQNVTPTATTQEYIENIENIEVKKDNPPPISPLSGRVGVDFYGMFHNVELLPSEHRALVERFSEDAVNEAIDDLSCKIGEGTVESLSHYHTLTYWLRCRKAHRQQPNDRESELRALWATLTPQEQQKHLQESGGIYPWQDPKYMNQ